MGFLDRRIYVVFAILIGILTASSSAYATYTNIEGTWAGSASGTDISCNVPSNNGPFTDQLTVLFSNQSAGNFDVSVTSLEADGTTSVDSGSGSFTSETTTTITH